MWHIPRGIVVKNLCKAHLGSDFGSQAPTVLMISQVGFLAFSGTCQARG